MGLVTGADPCHVTLKAKCSGREDVWYCATHNMTYSARKGHKRCPFGRKGKQAKMWTLEETK